MRAAVVVVAAIVLVTAAPSDRGLDLLASRPEERRMPRTPRVYPPSVAPAPAGPALAVPAPARTLQPHAASPSGARRPLNSGLPSATGRGTDWSEFAMARLPENAPATSIDGTAWIAANDLARLLDATKFWRADVRKLALHAHGHRFLLVADNPFAIVDDRVVLLPAAVRPGDGELYVPVAFIDSLPRDSVLARLVHDPRRGRVFRVPAAGLVGTPRIEVGPGAVRIAFAGDRAAEVAVVGLGRAHFRLHFPGFFVGTLPADDPGGVLRSLRAIPASTGSAFELDLSPAAAGFRIQRSARGVVVEIATAASPGLEAFAPEDVPGPRPLRVIVIDPGHGGDDTGVSVGGAVEKDLALALALRLKTELERRTSAQVVLTRDGDVALTVQQRAEHANRVHADLVLSLHFDGAPGAGTLGATVYCPPATLSASAPGPAGRATPVVVLSWRDAAIRHAVRSRELAESLRGSLELSGQGPARIRERLAQPLLGVNAPALLLEVATLTSKQDRERVLSPRGLPLLAAAIAAGIDSYRAGGVAAGVEEVP